MGSDLIAKALLVVLAFVQGSVAWANVPVRMDRVDGVVLSVTPTEIVVVDTSGAQIKVLVRNALVQDYKPANLADLRIGSIIGADGFSHGYGSEPRGSVIVYPKLSTISKIGVIDDKNACIDHRSEVVEIEGEPPESTAMTVDSNGKRIPLRYRITANDGFRKSMSLLPMEFFVESCFPSSIEQISVGSKLRIWGVKSDSELLNARRIEIWHENSPVTPPADFVQRSFLAPTSMYADRLAKTITRNMMWPNHSNLAESHCEVEVTLNDQGQINGAQVVTFHGDKRWCDAVMQTLAKIERMPVDANGVVPHRVRLHFSSADAKTNSVADQ